MCGKKQRSRYFKQNTGEGKVISLSYLKAYEGVVA